MTIVSYDPKTAAANGVVPESSREDVRRAVARATAAAAKVADASPSERSAWLHAVADALESDLEALTALADSETGLGPERLRGEVLRTAGQLRFYGQVAAEGSYLGVTIDPAARLVRLNRPLGPVAVFGASNFPFAFGTLGNDFASAAAAGCPVVAKSHPAHPMLAARLSELAAEALTVAGAPPGTFAAVAGHHAGTELVQANDIAAVAFTGSQAGGMALWRLASERAVVIPVYAEMGTVNPVLVTPSAGQDIGAVARGFVGSFTAGAGQFCTKPGLLFAPAGTGAAVAVAAALRQAAPQPVMLTGAIADSVRRGLGELRAAGARIVALIDRPGTGWTAPAAVLAAPVDALEPGSRLLEECFGPVAVVVEYASTAELRSSVARLQGALAASVVTDGTSADPDASAFLDMLTPKVGRVVVDGRPTGVAYSWAQQHGGPWPATSCPQATSVGAAALDRFVRPVAYQSVPDQWLPPAAQPGNPWQIPHRTVGDLP
ncbi:aldehyde dehydrogenase family protein [Amycolatopsis sp. NPDC059090]|uniref:aldehyde dehydrogenase family protein n=1 Tax=unclassified Amycolatopsis TaxID=2618356 RepID=UPI00366F4BBF